MCERESCRRNRVIAKERAHVRAVREGVRVVEPGLGWAGSGLGWRLSTGLVRLSRAHVRPCACCVERLAAAPGSHRSLELAGAAAGRRRERRREEEEREREGKEEKKERDPGEEEKKREKEEKEFGCSGFRRLKSDYIAVRVFRERFRFRSYLTKISISKKDCFFQN